MKLIYKPPKNMANILRLPLEIRSRVYEYILPYTIERPDSNGTMAIWNPGQINLLSVCHVVYEECMDILYGDNIFNINIESNRVRFNKISHSVHSSVIINKHDFFNVFSERNFCRMRQFLINIHQPVEGTCPIKYEFARRNFDQALRLQIEAVVDVLNCAKFLRSVKVQHDVGNWHPSSPISANIFPEAENNIFTSAEKVLSPFSQLSDVRTVNISGAVNRNFAKAMEKNMSTELWRRDVNQMT